MGGREFPQKKLPSNSLVPERETATTAAQWAAFKKRYRAEMSTAESSHTLDLLAELSHHSNFSVGCYCEDEDHCHRSVLRELLQKRDAAVAP